MLGGPETCQRSGEGYSCRHCSRALHYVAVETGGTAGYALERSVQDLISHTARHSGKHRCAGTPRAPGQGSTGLGIPVVLRHGAGRQLLSWQQPECVEGCSPRYWSRDSKVHCEFHHLWINVANKMIADLGLGVLHSTSEISSLCKTQTSVCPQYRTPHRLGGPPVCACVSPGQAQMAPAGFS